VINARWSGSGPLVLAIHGLGCSLGFWDGALALLGPSCQAVAIDVPGFGQSPPLPAPWSVPGLASAVSAWLDEEGIDRVVVIGHSLGGMIAQELAGLEAARGSGRIRGLVLCCTIPAASERVKEVNEALADLTEREGSGALADAVMPAMLGPEPLDGTAAAAARFRRDFAASADEALAGTLRAIGGFDARAHLSTLADQGLASLVVAGEHEANQADQQLLARLLRARYVIVPGTRHLAPAESPRRFSDAVGPFLESLASGAAWQ